MADTCIFDCGVKSLSACCLSFGGFLRSCFGKATVNKPDSIYHYTLPTAEKIHESCFVSCPKQIDYLSISRALFKYPVKKHIRCGYIFIVRHKWFFELLYRLTGQSR